MRHHARALVRYDMTKLSLAFALLVAAGCSKPTPEKACKHILELTMKDLDRQIENAGMAGGDMGASMQGSLTAMKKEMKEKIGDAEACGKKLEASGVDLACILDADRIDGVAACMQSKK
jgi:hypothetical protein